MALNPRIWFPIAVLGCLVNVVGAAFALGPAEPWHPALHAALAVAFGVWAQHLRTRLRPNVQQREDEPEVAALRDEVGLLRRELSELQERMDFAERLLTQARDKERVAGRRPNE